MVYSSYRYDKGIHVSLPLLHLQMSLLTWIYTPFPSYALSIESQCEILKMIASMMTREICNNNFVEHGRQFMT